MGTLPGLHTLKERILPDDLPDNGPGEYPMRSGNGFTLTATLNEDGITGFVGHDAAVVERVEVENGVIYVLNGVLVPPLD
jgi:uncharacterized surface protein with fasciclin (FAS1) repeats